MEGKRRRLQRWFLEPKFLPEDFYVGLEEDQYDGVIDFGVSGNLPGFDQYPVICHTSPNILRENSIEHRAESKRQEYLNQSPYALCAMPYAFTRHCGPWGVSSTTIPACNNLSRI